MRDQNTSSRPSGRRVTPLRATYRRLATTAEIGTVTRGQLAVLAQNLPCTGLINATEAHLLTIIINTASAADFDRDGRPIVFKSNAQLAFEIDRSENRVSRLLSRLFDAGLISMQDSANYKRYPVRNGKGEIVDVCGIDLRVMIARYAELDELVRRRRAERAATTAALRRYRGALRNLRYALACAEDLATRLHAMIERRLEKVVALIGVATKAPAPLLRRATAVLEWLVERVMQLPSRRQPASWSEKTTCTDAVFDMHKQITTPHHSENIGNDQRRSANAEQLDSLGAGSASQEAWETSLGEPQSQVKSTRARPQSMVALHDVVRALPMLQGWGLTVPRTWGDLIRMTPQLCMLAGISEDARRRAVEQMGEQQAAVAVAVTVQKYDEQLVKSAGGYLRAMTKRAATGELHLARSVFGLAARNSAGASQ
ncbi:MAG: replication initiation protein RepC [Mesorhizobium sp.]|nr:plasmid replication protein RepC [Mesorhizobium sp.]MCO5164549.1 replication initiation protein RepC [Mesorhizobium sp.]